MGWLAACGSCIVCMYVCMCMSSDRVYTGVRDETPIPAPLSLSLCVVVCSLAQTWVGASHLSGDVCMYVCTGECVYSRVCVCVEGAVFIKTDSTVFPVVCV